MTFRAKATVIFTSLALTLPACSVKEDRDDCPCLLTVDTSQTVEGSTMLNITHASLGTVAREELPDGTSSFSTEVPRGSVYVSAFSNPDDWVFSTDGMTISLPEGTEPGRIYAHSDLVDCSGEEAWDGVLMYKQWCTIEIMLEDPTAWEDCSFSIEGSWSGFSLSDFSAVSGAFNCQMRRVSDYFVEARVTRQGDDGLILRVSPDDRTIAIGEAIANAGYDWSMVSLNDINISLSDTELGVSVEVVDWEDGQDGGDPTI